MRVSKQNSLQSTFIDTLNEIRAFIALKLNKILSLCVAISIFLWNWFLSHIKSSKMAIKINETGEISIWKKLLKGFNWKLTRF